MNIAIPTTHYDLNSDNLNNLKINFPCIIKPAFQYKFIKRLKYKSVICYSQSELLEYYTFFSSLIPKNEIIIQEYIPLNDRVLCSTANFFINTDEKIQFCVERVRQFPINIGNFSTYVKTIYNKQLMELSTKLLKYSNFIGLCEIEFIINKRNNELLLIEVNPRIWGWHYISKVMDIKLLLSFYNLNYSIKCTYQTSLKESVWVYGLIDIKSKVSYYRKGLKIHNSNIKNRIDAVYDIHDLKPFFNDIYVSILFLSKRIIYFLYASVIKYGKKIFITNPD